MNYKSLFNYPIKKHQHYRRWQNIKRRCFNTKSKDYPNYGGRGITMYPNWIDSAAPFCKWLDDNLGQCPVGSSLDRINNNGNYEPGNLKWSNSVDQTSNQRNLTGCLTDQDVWSIKSSNKTNKDLAQQFNCSIAHVNHIRRNRKRSYVQGPSSKL